MIIIEMLNGKEAAVLKVPEWEVLAGQLRGNLPQTE